MPDTTPILGNIPPVDQRKNRLHFRRFLDDPSRFAGPVVNRLELAEIWIEPDSCLPQIQKARVVCTIKVTDDMLGDDGMLSMGSIFALVDVYENVSSQLALHPFTHNISARPLSRL
jgi:hypothetical protein